MPVIPSNRAWDRVSRAADVVDRYLQRGGPKDSGPQPPAFPTIPARIVESRLWNVATDAEWQAGDDPADAVRQFAWIAARQAAVSRDWGPIPEGRSSTVEGDPYAIPAYGADRTADIAPGTIVQLLVAVDDELAPFAWITAAVTQRFHAGRITAVNGAVNATYDAESLTDSSIAVTGAEPLSRRLLNTGMFDFLAVPVGFPCTLYVGEDDQGEQLVELYDVPEEVKSTQCGAPAAAPPEEAMAPPVGGVASNLTETVAARLYLSRAYG